MAAIAMPDVSAVSRPRGGDFLFTDQTPDACFFPEDFTEEQRQIAGITAEFGEKEVLPKLAGIEAKDYALIRGLLKQAAELGLTSVDIPEAYGGLEMNKATSALIAESISINGSFGTTFSAHTGIGTLPLIWYGTPEQKAKYLPRLADGTLVAAYALSESSSGSDALSARTRAVLSEDGQTYTLNGEKMWITNGGFADLYTVFAKCLVPDGPEAGKERLTAFLIERGTPGFTNGPEEHKLGIRGSSTTPLILNDCKIPASNLLGQVGKGHHIAFNILNVGRYKLGNAVIGSAKHALKNAIAYAKDRRAFGKSISEFGLVQEKIAKMATAIYVAETVCYRTVGLIDKALADVDKNDSAQIQKRISDYAVECSIVKVWTSEMLGFVTDESLQIFGGYGYVEEFPAERAYRDARIHRIFEGTNEINRLIISGTLAKGALGREKESLPQKADGGPEHAQSDGGEKSFAAEYALLRTAKQITRSSIKAALRQFGAELTEEQEVLGAIADMVMAVFALESVVLRAHRSGNSAPGAVMATAMEAMTRLFSVDCADNLRRMTRKVASAIQDPQQSRDLRAGAAELDASLAPNVVTLSREVAKQAIEAGRYML